MQLLVVSSAWNRLAENRINEAIESGEFADLPKGQPLDLSEYFALPEGDRMAISMLRNAGLRSPEVDLLKSAVEVEERLAHCQDVGERRRLTDELQRLRVSFSLAQELRLRGRREPGV